MSPLRTLFRLGALFVLIGPPALAQPQAGPRVLLVQAHPDDETMYAAALYRITRFLNGTVDLALVTDGSGGYDYAMLAEPIYGKALADEPSARVNLPAVRKQELMEGGKILGIRNYFFLDELDHAYTLDVDTVLQHVWDADDVKAHLREILVRGDYDYVLGLLPTPSTHAHHKGATILALEAVRALDAADRPVVLGGHAPAMADTVTVFTGLPGYPITNVKAGVAPFTFDRRQPLESDNLLDYQVIVNWVIAEHKSQGTLQPLMNRGGLEHFYFFDLNDPSTLPRTTAFFEALNAGIQW